MSTLRLALNEAGSLNGATREDVARVFVRAFQVDNEAESCLAPYFDRVKKILLAWRGNDLLGFQFYQEVEVDGEPVHHFSLAARVPDPTARGLQGRLGRFLIGRCVWRTVPWRPVWLAGVTNSYRSYFNMHAVGGAVYPDVLRPDAPNPFGAFYGRVAEALSIPAPDSRGLLRGRMQGLGFGLVRDEDPGERGLAYSRYVENDLRDGIFALVRMVPGRDVPAYLLRRRHDAAAPPIAAVTR